MDPAFFIKIIDGNLVLWNYSSHEQFEIDIEHLQRLFEIYTGTDVDDDAISRSIKNSQCLVEHDPAQWGWDCLSRIFHVGTQIRLAPGEELPTDDGYAGYVKYCASIIKKVPTSSTEKNGVVVPLPAPDLDLFAGVSLRDVLLKRKCCRNFTGESLSVELVSNLLWATFGAVHGNIRKDMEAAGLMPVGFRRTSPSGGSLQASEAYLVAMRVDGLPRGIYHYRSNKHELSIVREGLDGINVGALLCAQMFANDLAFGVVVSTRFDRIWWKYPHSRAYRVALLDIGCLTQTFQLACTALECQSWITGYFIDEEVNRVFEFDNATESAMFFLGAGRGEGSFASDALIAVRNLKAKAHENSGT